VTARAKIVSAVPLAREQLERLAEWDVEVVDFANADRDDLRKALAGADGLLTNSHAPVDQEMIDQTTRLRVISTISVGYDHSGRPHPWVDGYGCPSIGRGVG
jgi:phosphoglycerate dehydrogenase-like enzyme